MRRNAARRDRRPLRRAWPHGSFVHFDRYGHLFPRGEVTEDMNRLEAAILVA